MHLAYALLIVILVVALLYFARVAIVNKLVLDVGRALGLTSRAHAASARYGYPYGLRHGGHGSHSYGHGSHSGHSGHGSHSGHGQ